RLRALLRRLTVPGASRGGNAIIRRPSATGSSMSDHKARILDGKHIAEQMLEQLRGRVEESVARGLPRPGLAMEPVREDPATTVCVSNKRRAAEKVGFQA